MRLTYKSILFLALCLAILTPGMAQVQVSMPDTVGTKPDTITVPIWVSDLTGEGVYSAEFEVDYDPNVVDAVGIKKSGTRADTLQPTVHFSDGRVSLAFAATAALEGAGDFVGIKFRLLPDANPDSTALTFATALFNEGTPGANTQNGMIRIRAIHINPSESTLFEGDSIQFQVTGTVTTPVSWGLTNSSVAQIDSDGKFHALQRGFTKVYAEDATGLQDTSGNIVIESVQLRDLTLTIPDTSYTQTLTFDLPVYISDVSALDIRSMEFTFSYDQHDLVAKDVITTGAIADLWGIPTFQIDNGQVRIASAGTNAISGGGVLLYIRFKVKADASGSSTFDISDALFNEDVYANIDQGQFSVIQAPDISISPADPELTNGDVLQFAASGGTPPYTWETDNSTVASIDNSGLLTTHQSGSVQVKVEDSEGFRDSTESLIVNDFKVIAPDTTGYMNKMPFSFPLYVDRDVSGFGIYSFEFTMHSSDTSIIRIDTVETSGTLAGQWGNIVSKDTADFLDVAATGTSSLTGSKPLVNVMLELGSSASAGDQVTLSFSKMMMNEGEPSITVQEGSFTLDVTSLEVWLPDTSGNPGSSISVPVQVPDNTTGMGITSYDFEVAFDSTLLTATGTDKSGSLSSGYSVTHTAVPGTIEVSATGGTPLSGTGDLLFLEFDMAANTAGISPLEFVTFQFNTGIPGAIPHSGNLRVGNRAPVAVNDTTSTDEDEIIPVFVLRNDWDPDGDSLSIADIDTSMTSGSVSIQPGDSVLTYTPREDSSGTDSLEYVVQDEYGVSDTATVYLTIQPVNDPPAAFSLIAPDDSTEITITNDNLANNSLLFEWQASSDVDSDSLTYGFSVQSGDLNIIAFADTGITSVGLAYQWLENAMDNAGVDVVSGDWTVLTTDGQDTTTASNGPRYLVVDATMVAVGEESGLPTNFALEQNYPNPFNPTTTIRYEVPKSSHVEVTVYDLLGNKVRTLVDEQKSIGRYSIRWNGKNRFGHQVSTGVYWYRMEAADFYAVRKMVFMK